MFKLVNILLAGCLLWCPYVCLGERTPGGCGEPFCTAPGESIANQAAGSAKGKCRCCKHEVESQPASTPHEHPPSPRKRPRQCICEGAPAITDVRVLLVDLTHTSTLFVDGPTHLATGEHGMQRPGAGDSSHEQLANCDICVRVCALLL